MLAITSRKRSTNQEDEPPEKKLTSDGDILIKELYKKQTNTCTTLSKQLLSKKQFEKSTEFVPLTSRTSGASTLQQFAEIVKHSNDIEKFKSAGLNEEDINLLIESNESESLVFEKHKNYEKSLLEKRLKDIKKVVEEYELRQVENNKTSDISERSHKNEFALSVKPNSLETKLLKFALDSEKQDNVKLPHPMDQIKEIENDCFGHLQSSPLPSFNKIRKKCRNLANKIKHIDSVEITPPNTALSKKDPTNFVSVTKWDSKEITESCTGQKPSKLYSCSPGNLYTIKDGQIIRINKDNSSVSCKCDNSKSYKQLSIEEIKKIERFQNYEPGNPTNVLYLKNLPKKVTEEEINSVLSNYKDSVCILNILTGKMSGQAFVTFSGVAEAEKALNSVNGTFIRNKPVIIQFGKRTPI